MSGTAAPARSVHTGTSKQLCVVLYRIMTLFTQTDRLLLAPSMVSPAANADTCTHRPLAASKVRGFIIPAWQSSTPKTNRTAGLPTAGDVGSMITTNKRHVALAVGAHVIVTPLHRRPVSVTRTPGDSSVPPAF